MNLVKLRKYCLGKKAATEDFPFDETTLVFRVGIKGKIFALTDIEAVPFSVNLKSDPERAVELRETYSCIIPAWHMNKQHWNTIIPDETISDALIYDLIDHSYELIVNSLKKKDRENLGI